RGNIKQVTAAQVGGLIEAVAGEASFKRRVEAMSRTFRDIEDSGIGVRILERIMRDFPNSSSPPAAPMGRRHSLSVS
ncbi:MAG TPA: hypothetical protein VJ464_02845, partial [Blastocatellia bacterium]|nr:hypothetical protein [Blastocatellia bacterium]